MIEFFTGRQISPEDFRDLLVRSTLGERRPIDDPKCLRTMLERADLTVTAWRGDRLLGIARSVTDFAFCCYLSDLAVDITEQRSGVGTELIRRTRECLGPRCTLILLSAPAAVEYYPRVGFTQHPSAWILPPANPFRWSRRPRNPPYPQSKPVLSAAPGDRFNNIIPTSY